MRATLFKIGLAMLVVVATPQLAFADEQPSLSQRWNTFTTAVEQKVVEIWNNFMGTKPGVKPDEQRGTASAPTPSNGDAGAGAPNAAPITGAAPTATAPAAATPGQPGVAAPVAATPVAPSPAQEIKKAREEFKAKTPFTVSAEGQSAAADLKKTKAGVPMYDFSKVKSIPALNVGREPVISRQNFQLPDWNWKLKELEQFKQLASPAAIKGQDAGLTAVIKAQPVKISPADQEVIDGRVTKEKVDKVSYQIDELQPVQEKPFEVMSPEFVKMLVTKILFEKGGHCPVVIGLADSLSSKPEFHNEAIFEAGVCAKEAKLNQAAFDRLGELVKKGDAEFGPKALATLGQDLPIVFEAPFYEAMKSVEGKEEFFSDRHAKNEIFYRGAKGAFKLGAYKSAEKLASRVESGSTFGPSAQYVVGISQYGAKDRTAARATLEKLAQQLENSSDTVLKGLVQVDLARMDFTAHKFDQAYQLYLKTPKDHPLWVQALIEQGWTQLALDDYAGAIGNMYSLHSPYFRVLYQPESFVVRTVGYLDICQYGDAYKTLTKLEQDYRDWLNKLNGYLNNKTAAASYETVKQYLRSKSNTDVEGLPYQLVREAARGKEFLTVQTAINDKSDEMGMFSGVSEKIRKEKDKEKVRAEQAKARAQQLAAKLAALQQAGTKSGAQVDELKRNMEKERMRSVPNHYVLEILEQSQQAFGQFQKNATAKLAESQHKLAAEASQVLFHRFQAMKTEMGKVLDNNEFLRYEIFAGSGENIRYQVAGGQTGGDNRLPASVKPEKNMNWTFDGEFWADEIGNYRSSLRNNCPKSGSQGAR
jgi:hypothetical protein